MGLSIIPLLAKEHKSDGVYPPWFNRVKRHLLFTLFIFHLTKVSFDKIFAKDVHSANRRFR